VCVVVVVVVVVVVFVEMEERRDYISWRVKDQLIFPRSLPVSEYQTSSQ